MRDENSYVKKKAEFTYMDKTRDYRDAASWYLKFPDTGFGCNSSPQK